MPFRTRDFTLFLLAVAFLVVGITATVEEDLSSRSQSAAVVSFATDTEVASYEAVVPPAREVPRASRLAELRAKIADFVFPETPVVEEEVVVEETEEVPVVPGSIVLCGNYHTINPAWSPAGLQFEIVEGARLVYRETEKAVVDEFGVSSVMPEREVVAQLPLRGAPQASKSCIPTDVVGIALDGSLIRNNEHTLYRVFGEETLIGYALDGFPIYGLSSRNSDECGGVAMSTGYGYVLSTEREGVLGCFSGAPVSL
ncbi:hypothetical protein A3I99_00035 [Candidatus Kaiserbacteria bacterium RIFCSPLOWO2_02_FULL_45_11b]|uniref:Uncharacterized protein n=1 Tax=Candidatus Kaiserbacteria bacterium RIFCSPLOWO2_12_FULL_45_26 TaxID=1798525 RepID=A0A1F6FGJ3_9BACT|nr:MAG: hypothetical protein A2Z56_02895 [Candidatus Kaiserbacteria bacterium RIFCSPHIGHO2_12_45_16]OGG71043.1 MAG: hypothetical protein A2929_01805 [Candidatus Kaiserbacteria bacterium RIFCSPLOWO2_01_FULL_45_25]OGG84178.1 MAG: hypothetical protein A3I99_00035 [Candidatus Kaiserbacteria bacterium RIFCSPLOWO2_02_FULL_45_11b]OGG84969.1 MAG: hypothetical protein A3G90_02795 [Candidatus Kaiserbacteria bacterium RIFCSPLOWO2_12_FULL_45_26]